MKMHSMLTLSTIALMTVSSPLFSAAMNSPSFGVNQLTDSNAKPRVPTYGSVVLARGGDENSGSHDASENEGDDDHGKRRGGNHDTGHQSRNDDRKNDDGSASGRRRPRVPGGSGCDDPGDIAEHPSCSL